MKKNGKITTLNLVWGFDFNNTFNTAKFKRMLTNAYILLGLS